MSKRFGRNQKRAMREQIKILERSVLCKNEKINELRTDLYASSVVIERTKQVLGDHFVTLPVQTTEVEDMLRRFKVSIFSPTEVSYSKTNSAVLDALDYIELDTHQASVHADELRGMIHMHYRSISGEVAYSLSDNAWRKLSESHLVELLKQRIAPEMAQHLIRERKKRYL